MRAMAQAFLTRPEIEELASAITSQRSKAASKGAMVKLGKALPGKAIL
jgi:hypothetical protein